MNNIFLPKMLVDTVFDIDVQELKGKGVKAFIFDIDNTLATYEMSVPDEKTAQWLKELKDSGFSVYLISNNNRSRVQTFAESVDMGYFARALKPFSYFLKKACRNMGVLPKETALVGDQLFTDVWGGNYLKMHTVLVKPISEVEDGFVKFKRRFERKILKNLK